LFPEESVCYLGARIHQTSNQGGSRVSARDRFEGFLLHLGLSHYVAALIIDYLRTHKLQF
jgi:hypothetical protein